VSNGSVELAELAAGDGLQAAPAQVVAPDDALARALEIVAKLLGRPLAADALCAGLPLENHRLTPALFVRAAERGGLSASIVRKKLPELRGSLLPAVLLLEDRGACVLLGVEGERVDVAFADGTSGSTVLALDALEARYAGTAILVRRGFEFKAGTLAERLAQTHHWFWGTLARSWRIYGEVALATVLINVFSVLTPLFFMHVYDRVVPNRAYETLWVLALGVAVVYVFDFLLKALRGYFVDVAGKRADVALSAILFEHVLGARLAASRAPVGAMANNLKEFDSLREFFTSATIATLIDVPFVLLFLAVIWLVGGSIVLAPLVAAPLVLAAGLAVQAPLAVHIRKAFAASEARHATLIESLSAMETVKTLGAAGQLQRRWEGLADFMATHSLASRFLSGLAVNFSAFAQLMVAIAVVVMGVYRIDANELSLGALIACTIIAGRALAPLTQVAALLTRYHQSMSALTALNKIMDLPLERPRDKSFVQRGRLAGEIALRELGFAYPDQPMQALSNLSFALRPGDRLGVIGRIGSGKSTLLKLLCGLYEPGSGAVLIDGIDLRQLDPADLRRNIGYVPQNLVLFAGSVKENLVIGAPHAGDEALVRAARIAGVDEFVNAHPSGFDMPVGERGDALSGGQRQAVAIARALLLDPPLLAFDEPTHSMDQGSEARIIERLTSELGGKTVIVATHRMSLLALVEKVLVLDAGRAIAFGPKDAVLKALAEGKLPTARAGR
jgi:ATP-binding cassette subfamily C protein LapB